MHRWYSAILLAVFAAPATAERVDDRYERKRVEPGELISRTIECPRGAATGGGYYLPGQPDDRVLFNVTANFPLADGRWRVDLRNVSGENQPLVLQIYAICLD